jgi:hypothetical protein
MPAGQREQVGFLIRVLAQQRGGQQRHGAADFRARLEIGHQLPSTCRALPASPSRSRRADDGKFILAPRFGVVQLLIDLQLRVLLVEQRGRLKLDAQFSELHDRRHRDRQQHEHHRGPGPPKKRRIGRWSHASMLSRRPPACPMIILPVQAAAAPGWWSKRPASPGRAAPPHPGRRRSQEVVASTVRPVTISRQHIAAPHTPHTHETHPCHPRRPLCPDRRRHSAAVRHPQGRCHRRRARLDHRHLGRQGVQWRRRPPHLRMAARWPCRRDETFRARIATPRASLPATPRPRKSATSRSTTRAAAPSAKSNPTPATSSSRWLIRTAAAKKVKWP